MQHLNKVHPVS